MKKVFFAVLAIAAMMVSCQKNGLVNTQKETPEVNEPQPVVLGSNIFKAPATKTSIDDMVSWVSDGKSIYVWALNINEDAVYPVTGPDDISKVFIDNVAASLSEDSENPYIEGVMNGSLDLKDEGGKPFYYGTSDDDIYDFYAYYLGYNLNDDGVETAARFENDAITVTDVNVNGTNDIMAATTDKFADAVTEDGMVNPRYLYSQYSARHKVTPNLVFKHMLSKFTFNVRCGSTLPDGTSIKLNGISFAGTFISGTLTLTGDTPNFAPAEATGDIALTELGITTLDDDYGDPAGYLMVVPAGKEGEYTLKIDYTQTTGEDTKSGSLTRTISYEDVADETGAYTAESIDAGKHYVVNITVYGFEEVTVNVQLVPWDDAGIVTIDPDQKEDGIMKQVSATFEIDGGTKNCTLFAEKFEVPEDGTRYDAYCLFEGETKLVSAPEGVYTVTSTDSEIESVTVDSEGKISQVTPKVTEPETEPEN